MAEEKLFRLDPEIARAIQARRRPKIRWCPVCGGEFTTVGRGLYDSPACARRAAYLRHRERQQREQAG